ncbi:scavenger mRNA decapping enzyme [Dichomitus squalens LYAD-421 SS1]|uniref:Scavenger mRNA decapping enzyme n=2 Tax=Dichomitus squalens TaxID=114155 RepID=A0A4Q9ME43_9APHY|nr:scavenger mRNA decapping enzyme [Dichomitus squalens LYAD-421 SS1]EJF56971.1 scavenger mRNA decapping enzyme [Dichomitus squalens LYAD-421 SS1]TBU24312.1 scavenger mRNA decapping enzyme [Dichomitus squalens]
MSRYELATLKQFQFERVLNEDPITHALTLLGKLPVQGTSEYADAVVRIEKTALQADSAEHILTRSLESSQLIEGTDIYTWLFGWLASSSDSPDVKINIVHPATEVHIRKYSRQEVAIVHETPALYDRIVRPYIAAFPPSRTQWVENILNGTSEVEKVLYRDPSPEHGYLVLPDMKWDLITLSSLYLVAIAFNRSIRSLRDLTKSHLPMLKSIRREIARVVKDRWGLGQGSLRMFIHYQPSYYHFHVHIVNANHYGLPGMSAGQAHLLDDMISLLECDPDDGPSILQRMTFTYALGEQHGLYEPMKAAQQELGYY